MTTGEVGVLYIAHIEPRYRHAGHYIGWSGGDSAEDRWEVHLAGGGSPLIKAALSAGCAVTFHELGRGTRSDERRLHRRNNGASICPTCRMARSGRGAAVPPGVAVPPATGSRGEDV